MHPTGNTVTQAIFWGRQDRLPPILGALGSIPLLIVTPLLVMSSCIALEHFDASISDMLSAFWHQGSWNFLSRYFPYPVTGAFLAYLGWIALQALLYTLLPGSSYVGQPTPGGNVLTYKLNGLQAFIITISLFILAEVAGLAKLSYIATSWPGILVVANIYGVFITLVAYLKAHLKPSHPSDTRFSGSSIHDIYGGCELNPRWGENWDIKLFHIGRLGMSAWLMIDISFTTLQFNRFGYISNSMVIVLVLQGIYVLDFFWNEHWYLKTIDIHHDHFGFYLAWGSTAGLSGVYSLQSRYLARHPVDLSFTSATMILTIGIVGYIVFRSSNNQRLRARLADGKCIIWGNKAKVIRSSYMTFDGSVHKSLLLYSGMSLHYEPVSNLNSTALYT
ncbi:hypothetical protein AJ80_02348 [Polytolypa hystricis UAMH7299]|uniref:7-dehydrocholesterol reductase n=1 Tax=Polytolypa hystricis (strain UAMH7299) TaxID=1447883 RepID=A0A2B7YRR1_POLH7|nr:hypothetical protein AJ80_02348 [Polytolypa hystricis UAMH7299]